MGDEQTHDRIELSLPNHPARFAHKVFIVIILGKLSRAAPHSHQCLDQLRNDKGLMVLSRDLLNERFDSS